jgi:hypothetical protein
LKTKIFYSILKNAPAYYSAGVVAINSKVVGLAPGHELRALSGGAIAVFATSSGSFTFIYFLRRQERPVHDIAAARLPAAPGIDFTKLFFGRKLFGPNLIL